MADASGNASDDHQNAMTQRVSRKRACGSFARWLGKTVNRCAGWQVEGQAPDDARMLIIAAPHTSNWDFIYLIAAAFSLGLSVHWIGKESLFRGPLGLVLRFMGGIPIDRSRRNNLVASLAEEINASPGCVLVVPPEGTRGQAPYWKSGFFRIAQTATIPMVCGFLDYHRKVAGLGPVIPHDIDEESLMARLSDFYVGIQGKYPGNFGPVRLKETS